MKVVGLVAGWIFLVALTSPAGAEVPFHVPGSTLLNKPVVSLAELRFKNIVRQAYDVSCGAAALATIFNYYYGERVGEQELVREMLELGDKEKIRKEGFSLLEIKRFAERQGYVSRGYRLGDVKDLTRLTVPAITLSNVRGYAHFVVIKGVAGGQVFIADPAFGNRSRPLDAFANEWNGVILLVLSATREANSAFTLDPTLKAPVSSVIQLLDRGLRGIAPGAGQF